MTLVIKLDLLPEECKEVAEWMRRTIGEPPTRFPSSSRMAALLLWMAAFRATIAADGRRTSLRMDPEEGIWLADLIHTSLTGLNPPAVGGHLSRALNYWHGMLQHELAKRGHVIPEHDPSRRIDTGLTYRPERSE